METTLVRGQASSPNAAVPAAPSGAPRHALGDLLWSPSQEARLLRRAAVALAFLLGLAELRIPIASLSAPYIYGKDFLQEYIMARALAEGVDPYLPIPFLAGRFLGPLPVALFPHPTPHPPTVGLLLLPLASLDYPWAAGLWTLLELVCLVASVHLLGRISGLRPGARATLVASAIALPWYPILLDLALGQLMLPILLLLAGTQYALLSGRRGLGGALLGFILLLKPIAWPLLLVFVVRRSWRPLCAAVSTALLGYGAAAGVIGMGGVFNYVAQVLPEVARIYHATSKNISTWTIGWRLFEGSGSEALVGITAPPLFQSAQAAAALSAALPALVLLASLLAIRRWKSESRSLGLMICVAILISPISWSHYLVLAAVPAVEVGSWLIRHRAPPRETNLALLAAALMVPKDDLWARLALALAGQRAAPDGSAVVPFAPALLTLGPAVAVAAVAVLLIWVPGPALDRHSGPACGDASRVGKAGPHEPASAGTVQKRR